MVASIEEAKKDIAQRTSDITTNAILWSVGTAAVGALVGGAIGSTMADPITTNHQQLMQSIGQTSAIQPSTLLLPGAMIGGMGGMMAGSIGGILTNAARQETLKIDKHNLESRILADNWQNVNGNAPIPAPAFASLPHQEDQNIPARRGYSRT